MRTTEPRINNAQYDVVKDLLDDVIFPSLEQAGLVGDRLAYWILEALKDRNFVVFVDMMREANLPIKAQESLLRLEELHRGVTLVMDNNGRRISIRKFDNIIPHNLRSFGDDINTEGLRVCVENVCNQYIARIDNAPNITVVTQAHEGEVSVVSAEPSITSSSSSSASSSTSQAVPVPAITQIAQTIPLQPAVINTPAASRQSGTVTRDLEVGRNTSASKPPLVFNKLARGSVDSKTACAAVGSSVGAVVAYTGLSTAAVELGVGTLLVTAGPVGWAIAGAMVGLGAGLTFHGVFKSNEASHVDNLNATRENSERASRS